MSEAVEQVHPVLLAKTDAGMFSKIASELAEALAALTKACEDADAIEELPMEVDGSLLDQANRILTTYRAAAWNRRAKPPEGEPVAWLIEWVFKNSDPATIKRPGGGSMVARCRAEMEAQVANLRAWDRVAEYTVTALAPLYTRPVAWPDREAAPDLLEAAREADAVLRTMYATVISDRDAARVREAFDSLGAAITKATRNPTHD